jgi:hypothetical protein
MGSDPLPIPDRTRRSAPLHHVLLSRRLTRRNASPQSGVYNLLNRPDLTTRT